MPSVSAYAIRHRADPIPECSLFLVPCSQRKAPMRWGTMARLHDQQRQRALLSAVDTTNRKDPAYALAHRCQATALRTWELRQWYLDCAAQHDDVTKRLGQGMLADGEWIPDQLRPVESVARLGCQLAGSGAQGCLQETR